MTIYLIRGSHANEYELQNYYPLTDKLDIHLITTHSSLTPTNLPTIKLWSPADLPRFPYRRQILNRLIGGEQWLLGLEQLISRYHVSKHSNKSNIMLHTAETYTPYTHQAVQLRKKGLIKKLICTCWETIPHNNEKFARLRRWKQEAYRYVDLFHTPTQRAANALIKEGVDQNKIKVIPYGVDTKIFCPPRQKRKNKIPIILTVARRVPEKGLDIWEQVREAVGDKAEFRWVSNLPYRDMPAVYQSADLFFFPSLTTPTWEEQYGMALVEAMACGLPIVASNTGAIPEVVGSQGLLFDPHSVADAVKKLDFQLSHPISPQLPIKYIVKNVSNKLLSLYR